MHHLSISLFGPLLILRDGKLVNGFTYQKARALLVYLVLEAARPHSRDELVGLLWPDLPDAAARTNLRQALADLRKVLGDEEATLPYLLITRDSLQFNLSSDYELDVAQFITLLDSCKRHHHRQAERCPRCLERMQQAVAYYQGELLAGFIVNEAAGFEEWLLLKREAFHQRALTALACLTAACERRQQCEQAIEYARRQLELDPWREEAHQQLMSLYALIGQRSAALAQYETCRRILAQEFGVAPAAETRALYAQICAGANGSRPPAPPRPYAPVPLLGRERELAELGELLANPAQRLITITGLGGIGKTRLALAAAAAQADTFLHGAVFVDLTATSTANRLPQAILLALYQPLQGDQNPQAQLIRYLQDKELLLVLDNYEPLLPEISLLCELLKRAPQVTLLVTSRERLALQAEQIFALEGLPYPQQGVINGADEFAAPQLFLQRVRQFQRHFAPDGEEWAALLRICRATQGLPLALELAAAAVQARSCVEIATTLTLGKALVLAPLRDRAARHASIATAFEYSWRLLLAPEQQCLRQLAVFRGGFDRAAAQAVAGATAALLAGLVDKSLLQTLPAGRYTLHTLIQQFAADKLQAAGEAMASEQRHFDYCLMLAQQAETRLRGHEHKQWLDCLDANHDNLRAALAWALQHNQPAALALAGTLGVFWRRRGHVSEGRDWLQRALEKVTDASPARAKALLRLGDLAAVQGERTLSLSQHEASLHLFRTIGDRLGTALALRSIGWFYVQVDKARALDYFQASLTLLRALGDDRRVAQLLLAIAQMTHELYTDYAQACRYAEESLALAQALADTQITAQAFQQLAELAFLQGDYTQGQRLLQESLPLIRELGLKQDEGWALTALTETACHLGDYGAARRYGEAARALFTALGFKSGLAITLHHLGLSALLAGEPSVAQAHFCEALHLSQATARQPMIARCLAGLGGVAIQLQAWPRAASLLSAAYQLFNTLSPFLTPADHAWYKEWAQTTRTHLGETSFSSAWAVGQTMALEQAVAYAFQIPALLQPQENPSHS